MLATTAGERERVARQIPRNAKIQYQRLTGKEDAGKTNTNVRSARTRTAADENASRTTRILLNSGAWARPMVMVHTARDIPSIAKAKLTSRCRV